MLFLPTIALTERWTEKATFTLRATQEKVVVQADRFEAVADIATVG